MLRIMRIFFGAEGTHPFAVLGCLLLAGTWLYRRPAQHQRFERFFVTCIAVSGILYLLPLFVLAPATDFRYVLWLVVSAVVVCGRLLLKGRSLPVRPAPGPGQDRMRPPSAS